MAANRWSVRNFKLRVLFAFLAFLCVLVGLASSADATSQPEEAGVIEPPAAEAALPGGTESVILPETDPVAASTLETEGIGRAEAEEVLQQVFGDGLEASAEFFDDLEVEGFRSDYAALVAPPEPGASAGLISSIVPLRTEDESGDMELVDLDLEQIEGHFEPDNPLVEVHIPSELGDGITMPESGIRIEIPSGVDGRTASSLGDASTFFPNIDTDTDFVASAAPTGIETYTQLRSPQAPTEQMFHLHLPVGDQLEARPDGGAQVIAPNGDPMLVIRPPSAIDAEGRPNPVTLQVDGDSLVLSVSPRPDALYPILVDPLFESYTWGNGQGTSAGWKQYSDSGFSASWTMAGANVWSNEGATTPGNQAYINYYVPRYWEDLQDVNRKVAPTSYIRNMKLWNLYYTIYQNNPFRNHPYLWMGLWDGEHGTWISRYTRTASEGALNNPSWVYEMKNETPTHEANDDVKNGGFGLATSETWNGSRRDAYVGNATVEVSDDDYPGFSEMDDQVQGWLNASKKFAPYYKAGDNGLGIYQLRMRYPALGGGPGESITGLGCTGSAVSPCPYSAVKSFAYDPTKMAQGELDVRADVVDPVGHWSPASQVRIRVDHDAPSVTLSGNLTEQAAKELKLPNYILNYAVADGDDAAAAALSPVGTPGAGTGQLERPLGIAVDQNANRWVTDRVNNRIVEYDKNGAYVRQITGPVGALVKAPSAIAVHPTLGALLVAESSEKRVRSFDVSGTLLGTITTPAFSEPWGVAVAPNGYIWVSDPGAKKLFLFSEAGTLKQTIAIPSPGVPYGLDADEFGNAWVAVQGTDQILEYNQSGSQLFSFGSTGTGTGQFKAPVDIAVAPSGNLIITDDLNNRIKVHRPDGTFLRQYGTSGSGNAQLKEPRSVALAPGNQIVVADAGNKRIARWEHADQDPQSGAAKVEIKVDGTSKATNAPGCTSKNCVINSSWTMNADDYTVGTHKVEVIATDAVGISAPTKTVSLWTAGDRTAPTVALSGSITEQATLGKTLPAYKVKVTATDPGPAEERKSGVASIVIKVDGKVVDSTSPGCPAEGCSLNRELTLTSSSYSTGGHSMEATATDAAGRTKTAFLIFEIKPDTTAPEFQGLAAFYTAPSGWVEQKAYEPSVIVTDSKGYGVTSVQLKIDGQLVQNASQTCAAGGCMKVFGYGQPVDMVNYSGGAHPAELIASDGAGNTRKRSWTINVVPKGQVPPAEAEDTLEALEAVSEEVIVAPQSPEEPFFPGPASQSELKEDSSGFHTVGAAAETTLGDQPEEGLTIDTADGTVAVVPVGVDPAASSIESSSDISAISSNTGKTVDTIYRPIYDGAMTFQSIRASTGTDEFSWTVNLRPGQSLEMVDGRTAQIMSSVFERPVFTITAIEAHDAVGSTVPTTMSASGSTITLKVHHKAGNPAANSAPFVYPVIAGSGWEGGIVIHKVVGPPPTEQTASNPETWAFYELQVGPPELVPASEADGGASASAVPERRRNFVRSVCGHSIDWVESQEGGEAIAEGKLEGNCGNGFDPVDHPGKAVIWRGSMRGSFLYTPGVRVRHRGAKDCVEGVPGKSKIRFYAMKEAYECHFGPKTSDENGGVSASAGHYLRAQAHWELGERGKCWANQPSEECEPPDTCWMWQDKAIELHLWPSGNIDPIRLLTLPPDPC